MNIYTYSHEQMNLHFIQVSVIFHKLVRNSLQKFFLMFRLKCHLSYICSNNEFKKLVTFYDSKTLNNN